MIICYIGEFLFYPPIILVLSLINSIIGGVLGILIGALMLILLPFFPFYIMCLFCEGKPRETGTLLCTIASLSILILVLSALGLALSPLSALVNFFLTYYKIFSGEVNPYNSCNENWKVMTLNMNKQNTYLRQKLATRSSGIN